MFSYKTQKTSGATEIYCLLLTTVIASINGFVIDDEHTEVMEAEGLLAKFYRAYYDFVAGEYDKKSNGTINGIDLDMYRCYSLEVGALFLRKYGKEFSTLPELERFLAVFQVKLFPIVKDAVMNSDGIGSNAENTERAAKKFNADMVQRVRSIVEKFEILTVQKRELWTLLYDYAMDMPHVRVGLYKQVSSLNSGFFRANKRNLESLADFMRKERISFINYDKMSIAGVIVNHFKMHCGARWFKGNAGQISAGSAYTEDSDGTLMSLSETQSRMNTFSSEISIPNFENYMKTIEEGSSLFEIGHRRYTNLLEWRQNEKKKEILNVISESPLAEALAELDLTLGGYDTPADIEYRYREGNRNNGAVDKMALLFKWADAVYKTNCTSDVAEGFVEEWYKYGVYLKENGGIRDGNYPMDFRGKDTPKRTQKNKDNFRKFIKGVAAIKALESDIVNLGYTIMSLPIYDRHDEYKDNYLITGLSLADYLNRNLDAINTPVAIESDIETTEELSVPSVEKPQYMSSAVISALSRKNIIGQVALGSLADDISSIATSNSDLQFLGTLKSRGYSVTMQDNNVDSMRDLVFNNLGTNMITSTKACLPYDETAVGTFISKLQKKKAGEAVDERGLTMSMLLYPSNILDEYSTGAALAVGLSSNAEMYSDSACADPAGMLLDLFTFMQAGVTIEDLRQSDPSLSQADFDKHRNQFFFDYILRERTNKSKYTKMTNGYNVLLSQRAPDGKSRKWKNNVVYISAICRDFKQALANGDNSEIVKSMCDTLYKYLTNLNIMPFTKEDNENLFYPRMICLGVNISMLVSHIRASLNGIGMLLLGKNLDTDDKAVSAASRIHLTIKTLKAILTLYGGNNNNTYKDSEVKTSEDIFESFLESVSYDIKSGSGEDADVLFSRKAKRQHTKFVFLPMLEQYNELIDWEYDTTQEKLLQYRTLAHLVFNIMNAKGYYSVDYGNSQHTLAEFLGLIDDILNIDKEQRDKEFFINNISVTSISVEEQSKIQNSVLSYINSQHCIIDVSDGNTWYENLIDNSGVLGYKIDDSIKSVLRTNMSTYSVNSYDMVTYSNKVLIGNIQIEGVFNRVIATRYGLFKWDGAVAKPAEKVEDFRWLTYWIS